MTKNEMAIILCKAFLLYPQNALSEEIILAWYSLFSKVRYESFSKAMDASLKKPGRAFAPTPGEVQQELNLLTSPTRLIAEDAWERVVMFAARGAQGEPNFDEQTKSCLRRVGGIDRIRRSDVSKELPYIRRDFLRCFKEFSDLQENFLRLEYKHLDGTKTIEH